MSVSMKKFEFPDKTFVLLDEGKAYNLLVEEWANPGL